MTTSSPAQPPDRRSHINEIANAVNKERPKYSHSVPRFCYANEVAKELLDKEKDKGSKSVLKLVLDIWIDFLVMQPIDAAGNPTPRCSAAAVS